MDAEIEVLQNTLTSQVSTLSACLYQFMEELRKDSEGIPVESLLKSLRSLQKETNGFVRKALKSQKSQAVAVKKLANEKQAETSALQLKYDELLKLWSDQRDELSKARSELNEARAQLKSQSERVSTLASFFGSLLWKAFGVTNISAGTLLSSDTMKLVFMELVNTILILLEENNLRGFVCNEEEKCLNSILVILTNFLADCKGRHFISTTREGADLISRIVKILTLPDALGNRPRKILLTALYNISVNRQGHGILQNDETLLSYLAQVMCGEIGEVEILALRLADSVTSGTTNENTLLKMEHHISREKLLRLTSVDNGKARNLAKKISSNLKMDIFPPSHRR